MTSITINALRNALDTFLSVPRVYKSYRIQVNKACVQGSTNGIPISFKVLQMVPLVIPLVIMVMPMVQLALPLLPLPMVPLATNGTIGKITNGTIERTPNRAIISFIETGKKCGIFYLVCKKKNYHECEVLIFKSVPRITV